MNSMKSFWVKGLGRHLEVTFQEQRILKALEKHIKAGYKKPIPPTAKELRLAKHTIYTTLDRIRHRYNKSLEFGSDYRKWRRKLGDSYLWKPTLNCFANMKNTGSARLNKDNDSKKPKHHELCAGCLITPCFEVEALKKQTCSSCGVDITNDNVKVLYHGEWLCYRRCYLRKIEKWKTTGGKQNLWQYSFSLSWSCCPLT